MRLSDFDFELPPELVAQHPGASRSASRLLHVRRDGLDDLRFDALPALLEPGDLLVFNDTRVLRARLHGTKASGGRVEALVERAGEFWRLRFDEPVLAVLDRDGELPLPPYIDHAPGPEDERRYQTVYARAPGSVAAPTAGLHFDEPLLARLRERGVGLAFVTLHVGAGTFQPVRVEDLSQHRMHAERYSVPAATAGAIDAARGAGRSVVAIGTTSLRTLESAADGLGRVRPGDGETRLFITPGYRFSVVDRLVTNFHLPKSTLLMLVSAFAGVDRVRAAYAHAIAARYRFFSYGDAMLLEPDPPRTPPDAAAGPAAR